MSKIVVRRVFSTDTPRRRFLHDELLSGIPPGKCLCLGRIWTGELRPALDATLEAMRPIATGFSSGRTLSAEPSPATLDLGRTWLDQLRSKVLDATRNYEGGGKDDSVDLALVAAGIRDLSEALVSGDISSLAWATDGLRRARDLLDAAAAGLCRVLRRPAGHSHLALVAACWASEERSRRLSLQAGIYDGEIRGRDMRTKR